MAFHVRTGNRLERLAGLFCREVVGAPGGAGGLFSSCTAIVGSQGMAAFLAQKVGARDAGGIAFGLQTPFLTSFIDSTLPLFLDGETTRRFRSDQPLFERGVLALRIAEILSRHPERFPEFHDYLSASAREVRLLQLSARLAELIERCSLYRPELFPEAGSPRSSSPAWLTRLTGILRESGCRGRSHYIRLMLNGEPCSGDLPPERFGIFGVGSMPEVVLNFFLKLGNYSEIFFYLLSPCREYWGEVASRPERRRAIRSGDAEESDFSSDHPLLAELGGNGRDFFNLLLEKNLFSGLPDEECFASPGEAEPPPPAVSPVLARFQQDLLDDFRRGGSDRSCPAPGDDSISVHNCHNPRREVEILHDRLLAVLAEGESAPRDIVVMAPEITNYAALINAVFGNGPLRDCFALCDRPLRAVSHAAEAFDRIMRLHRGRGEVSEVMALLDFPVVRDRFGISESNRPQLDFFLADAAICWGEDAEDRRALCDVAFDEFSWRAGIDRLLLGMAVEEGDAEENSALWPAGNAEGGRAELLGDFAEFASTVFDIRKKLHELRSPEQWRLFSGELLGRFFSSAPEYAGELTALRGEIVHAADRAAKAGFRDALPAEAWMELLSPGLTAPAGKQHFLRDKITFCSFLPMRSVPAKVIALLGLGDGEFPRRDREDAFTLPPPRRRGDPSPSREDRYMLLETLVSARKKLLLFYSGRAPDGSEIPPCVPLAEIIELLRDGYGIVPEKHCRQPFDVKNFLPGVPDRRSFSRLNFEAARIIAGERSIPEHPSEFSLSIRPPEESLSAAALEKTLFNACSEFLALRFRLTYERAFEFPSTDAEPMTPDALTSYALREELFRLDAEGVSPEKQYRILSLSGRLPVGELGRKLFVELRRAVERIPGLWLERMRGRERIAVDLSCDGVRLSGFFAGNAAGSEHYLLHFSAPGARRLIRLRLGHLLMTLRNGGAPVVSHGAFLAADGAFTPFGLPALSVDQAKLELEELLEIRRMALLRALPLFPKSSCAFAVGFKSGDEGAEKAARAAFAPDFNGRGDAVDPAVELFFSPENFFSEEFRRLACTVYRPFAGEVTR